ncbi:uncharacterized protein LOC133821072 [Humulus lupulus]|uniref:uncharacterized protein LOC133821072 n=1 Tax=Humulus lupulus TaxID=3486 RepID=UPI002B417043|nr:uncharacterized protein LOC133821072 [Humulus lupulus]
MLLLLGQDDDDCDFLEEANSQELEEVAEDEVSLNTLSNSLNPRIYRFMAKHGSEALEVLIDTGSNNNFIQESLANQLHLPCEDTKRFKVYMGMQWLQTLGPCVHDHKALTMEFTWQGSVVQLAGSTDVSAHQLTYTQFHALLREGDVNGVYQLVAVMDEPKTDNFELAELESQFPQEGMGLLTKYTEVFDEPKQLPPYRGVDHRIFLQPGSNPVNVRPYRYPYF